MTLSNTYLASAELDPYTTTPDIDIQINALRVRSAIHTLCILQGGVAIPTPLPARYLYGIHIQCVQLYLTARGLVPCISSTVDPQLCRDCNRSIHIRR